MFMYLYIYLYIIVITKQNYMLLLQKIYQQKVLILHDVLKSTFEKKCIQCAFSVKPKFIFRIYLLMEPVKCEKNKI
jgi:hypothetical protein